MVLFDTDQQFARGAAATVGVTKPAYKSKQAIGKSRKGKPN